MIDEKKLILYLNDLALANSEEYETYKTLMDVIKIIENQPKVGEWIPCSERLPKFLEDVLVSTDDGHVYNGQKLDDGYSICGEYYIVDNHVLAWQPLPEPYKPE